MDWDRAITRNLTALQAIAAALAALLGLATGLSPSRIPLALHGHALRVLRPAESALRRLIVIAARGLAVKPLPVRPMPQGLSLSAKSRSRAAFRLFDPRKRFVRRVKPDFGPKLEPRIHVWGATAEPLVPLFRSLTPAELPPPKPDGRVSAAPLYLRLAALQQALSDIPRQAKRLARWQAKRQRQVPPAFTSPLRPGRPPGYRRNPTHEVDRVLAECHGLSLDALNADTS